MLISYEHGACTTQAGIFTKALPNSLIIFSSPSTLNDSAVMYGGFQRGPQLVPPDAERRQSFGQL